MKPSLIALSMLLLPMAHGASFQGVEVPWSVIEAAPSQRTFDAGGMDAKVTCGLEVVRGADGHILADLSGNPANKVSIGFLIKKIVSFPISTGLTASNMSTLQSNLYEDPVFCVLRRVSDPAARPLPGMPDQEYSAESTGPASYSGAASSLLGTQAASYGHAFAEATPPFSYHYVVFTNVTRGRFVFYAGDYLQAGTTFEATTDLFVSQGQNITVRDNSVALPLAGSITTPVASATVTVGRPTTISFRLHTTTAFSVHSYTLVADGVTVASGALTYSNASRTVTGSATWTPQRTGPLTLKINGLDSDGGTTATLGGNSIQVTAVAPSSGSLVVLGDSWSDTGRNPADNRYFSGRWSNGSLWPEVLSPRVGFAYNLANNFATAGTTTAGLSFQANQISTVNGGVCAIWSGGNDFLNAMEAATPANDALWDPIVSTAVRNITNAVHALYAKGGRSFLVFNLPDMGRVPAASAAPTSYQNYVSQKAAQFNSALGTALNLLATQDTGMVPRLVDVFANFNQILAAPAASGITVTAVGALDDASLTDKSFAGPGANYLFWDGIHPTAKTHTLIASWAEQALGGGNVPAPPVITDQPLGKTVVAGSNVTLSVTATGTPPLAYQWFRNGLPVPGASAAVLNLAGVNRAVSGVYTVGITNGGGGLVSSNAFLRVQVPQRFQPPMRLGDGRVRLVFGDNGGGAFQASDATNFIVYASTEATGRNASWTTVMGSMVLTNGQFMLEDTGAIGKPRRFYFIVDGDPLNFITDPGGH